MWLTYFGFITAIVAVFALSSVVRDCGGCLCVPDHHISSHIAKRDTALHRNLFGWLFLMSHSTLSYVLFWILNLICVSLPIDCDLKKKSNLFHILYVRQLCRPAMCVWVCVAEYHFSDPVDQMWMRVSDWLNVLNMHNTCSRFIWCFRPDWLLGSGVLLQGTLMAPHRFLTSNLSK